MAAGHYLPAMLLKVNVRLLEKGPMRLEGELGFRHNKADSGGSMNATSVPMVIAPASASMPP